VVVELHWALDHNYTVFNIDYEQIFTEAVRGRVADVEALVMPALALHPRAEGDAVVAFANVQVPECSGGRRALLLVHLGMTGQLFSGAATSPRLLRASARGILAPEAQPRFTPDEHTHLRLHFRDAGPEVFLRDARKFGKVLWLAAGASSERLDRLGIDALEATGDALFAASRGRSVAVKNLLLDQSVLAGVGNIYADEALFGARVRPTRRAGRVTRTECDRIAGALRRVLLRSIETGGSSISDYIAPDGADGAYQDERRVYARSGEPCLACGTKVKRIVLGQRSAHYCPSCQR
jgi:DNA-formamidopyrimidine glycosylase